MYRHGMARWREMTPNLYIGCAKTPSPIGKQITRHAAMYGSNPLGCDSDMFGIAIEKFVETTDNIDGQMF